MDSLSAKVSPIINPPLTLPFTGLIPRTGGVPGARGPSDLPTAGEVPPLGALAAGDIPLPDILTWAGLGDLPAGADVLGEKILLVAGCLGLSSSPENQRTSLMARSGLVSHSTQLQLPVSASLM